MNLSQAVLMADVSPPFTAVVKFWKSALLRRLLAAVAALDGVAVLLVWVDAVESALVDDEAKLFKSSISLAIATFASMNDAVDTSPLDEAVACAVGSTGGAEPPP